MPSEKIKIIHLNILTTRDQLGDGKDDVTMRDGEANLFQEPFTEFDHPFLVAR